MRGLSNYDVGMPPGDNASRRANVVWCMNNAFAPGNRTMLANGSHSSWRGFRPFDRRVIYNYFNTIIPPNGPSCTENDGGEQNWGIYPPQSRHSGGVSAGFLDGSVRFITDSVDTNGLNAANGGGGGSATYTGPSVFGVWGALGSIAGGESRSL